MEPVILTISVWVVLIGVVVIYVIWRLFTDRKTDSVKHPMYPLVSRASDGMFPHRSEKYAWGLYLILLVGLLAFVGIFALEVTGMDIPNWLIVVSGVSLLVGTLWWFVNTLIRRERK